MTSPYNPLDKLRLAESVMNALLKSQPGPLPPPEEFLGAGVYAIYYTGDFPEYREIARQNADNQWKQPIYVGKAIPAGGRKGGFGLSTSPGKVLFNRLNEHAESIRAAEGRGTLRLADFRCRYLVVDEIWIPLAEGLLIQTFQPVWNKIVDGFGNHDPGSGRYGGARPSWDVLHPGRSWAERCAPGRYTVDEIKQRISEGVASAAEET